MTQQTVAQTISIIYFIFWMLVLYAGADHPPPIGFLIFFPLVGLCAYVVYRRLPTYIDWHQQRKTWRYLRVLADGLIAGLCVAGLIYLIQLIIPLGDPTIVMSMWDHLIWISVLAVMGILNAVGLYVIIAVVHRIFIR